VTVRPKPAAAILPDQAALTPDTPGSARAAFVRSTDTLFWKVTGGTLVKVAASSVFYLAGPGPFLTVELTVSNGAGAVATATKTLAVAPAPGARAAGLTLFQPEPFTRGEAYEAVLPGGTSPTWTVTGGALLATSGASAFFQAGEGASLTLTATEGTRTETRTVTLTPPADATLTVADVTAGATGLTASVPEQPGATYAWTVTGGRLTAGAGTAAITFSAGTSAELAVAVTVTVPGGTRAWASRTFDLAPLEDDLDGDQDLDPLDLARFVPALGKAFGDPDYLLAADLDGDGAITDDDIELFKAALR
jgi:hypothetical protein